MRGVGISKPFLPVSFSLRVFNEYSRSEAPNPETIPTHSPLSLIAKKMADVEFSKAKDQSKTLEAKQFLKLDSFFMYLCWVPILIPKPTSWPGFFCDHYSIEIMLANIICKPRPTIFDVRTPYLVPPSSGLFSTFLGFIFPKERFDHFSLFFKNHQQFPHCP